MKAFYSSSHKKLGQSTLDRIAESQGHAPSLKQKALVKSCTFVNKASRQLNMSRHLTLLNRDRPKHILIIKHVLAAFCSVGTSSQPSL